MMSSLYAGVSGLKNHQTRMDVVGNNIANVNTIGYKKSRTVFQDMVSQTLRVASGTSDGANIGGQNPIQVGFGVSLGSVDVLHTQGASMATGNNMDVMIQGDGYFIVQDAGADDAHLYTRAGNFTFDEGGNLTCSSTGYLVCDNEGTPIKLDDMEGISNISINSKGYVTYLLNSEPMSFDNPIGIATFINPMGLEKVGMSMYRATSNSGGLDSDDPFGSPGEAGRGIILPGNLEMSNVDLAEEFTEMIITQRGHQANARTIRTSDEMLQELTQLKR